MFVRIRSKVSWIVTHTAVQRYCYGADFFLNLDVKRRANGQQRIEGRFDKQNSVSRIRLVVCLAGVKNLCYGTEM
jgi:hypothetical protein